MDAVVPPDNSRVTADRPVDNFHVFLPPDAPLAMPEQSLSARCDVPALRTIAPRAVALRRAFVFGGTAGLTAGGGYAMYQVLNVSGLTLAQAIVLALFVILVAWLAFSFASALGGLISILFGSDKPLGIDAAAPLPAISTRNALLLPTYNEAPHRIMARLQAIHESLEQSATLEQFDFFVLSDTTDPDIWIREEAALLALLDRTGSTHVFYRHRAKNTARKAGNIGEWVRRFGGAYEHMIILDADSLMTSDTIIRLVAAMEQHPRVGLIQTFPVIVNASTLFARAQQFAGRVYGPLIARGVAWWQGQDGNYWGHNAIIRVRAFAEQAGLPLLRGRKPFGGHILSHDFVEAALMRRAGWAVHMAPTLGGSYEESPPSLTDYAARDRRWCQGNLQHLGVLGARGLHWVSRLHLLVGIGAYLTAPLWFGFLVVGILISLQAQFIKPEYFPQGFSLFPNWPAQDPVLSAWVFAGTMSILLAPKLLGYVVSLAYDRSGFGGAIRRFLGVVLETLVSGLIAPVMMLVQSAAVAEILLGRDAGWSVQRRDDGTLPLSDLARRYGAHTLFGLLLAACAYAVSIPLFLWMTPVIAGLLLAVPLAALSSSVSAGRALRTIGLLASYEERVPPEILLRANELTDNSAAGDSGEAFDRLCHDGSLRAAHRAMLPRDPGRKRGEVDVDLVIGLARLDEAESLAEAASILTGREKAALLSDPRAFQRLAAMCDAKAGAGSVSPVSSR